MEPNNFQTRVVYATLGNMTKYPGAPMQVLNPSDAPYKAAIVAFNNGYLNPNQPNYPGNYFTISTAYGKEPNNLYATRGCSSSVIQS
ncbi:MAG: hypothetical protein EBX37_16295 [Alphaproteobacteria bacterium]|nr:hypothetical protein [Alphaproteobacteria bacterium]